jgi:hypothetical protein
MAAYDGTILINSKIDATGFNKGVKNISGGLSGLMGTLGRLGAIIGLVFSVGQIAQFGKTAVDAASSLSSAMVGLESVVAGQGASFTQAKKFIDEYISDGLVPATNAITAYKNLSMRGYDTTQIEQTLTILKDTAAFGRQASLSMGDAVQTATEGLKNENSILVDNAGVTKNVSMMWKDYAESIGTSVNNLTKQQKIQAEVNGLMIESRFQTGDAQKALGTYAGQVSALSAVFMNFKVALGNVIIPLLQVLIPIITKALVYLTIFLNKLAQVMAALFGVGAKSSDMNKVADNTNAAAVAQDNLAKSTTEAGKAAKGALAAFDDLNVLDTGTDAGAGVSPVVPEIGAISGGDMMPIDIEDTIALRVEKIKEIFRNAWESIKLGATNSWEWVKGVWATVADWFTVTVIDPLRKPFADLVDAVSNAFIQIKASFIDPLVQVFMNYLWPIIKSVFDLLVKATQNTWTILVALFNVGVQGIVGVITGLMQILTGIINFITGIFTGNWKLAWQGVTEILKGVFTTWYSIVKVIVNSIIEVINGMIRAISLGVNAVIGQLNKINVTIPSWVPGGLGGKSFGVNIPTMGTFQIPKLATGAVIPPNKQFAAILGDQKSGMNIESPVELMRQVVMEAIAASQGEQKITIEFTGSLAALARELKPKIDFENKRVGGSLVSGSMA